MLYRTAVTRAAALCLVLACAGVATCEGAKSGAQTNATLELLSSAKTTKGFAAERAVTEDQILRIIACGVNAPSAQNKQPWFFSAIVNPKLRDELRAAAKSGAPKGGPGGPGAGAPPGDQGGGPGDAPKGAPKDAPKEPPKDAKAGPGARDPLDNAPAAILISGAKDWRWSDIDCALACEAMSVAAQSMGLGTHIVLGPVEALKGVGAEALRKKLGVPEGMEPLILLLVGYPANAVDAVSKASTRLSGNFTILK